MSFFFKRSYKNTNYPALITHLEEGKKDVIKTLLYKNKTITYLPTTYTLLAKMKKPNEFNEGLSVYKTYPNGKYELIIFRVPWLDSTAPYLPLILDRKKGEIVGIMLPFNELLQLLTTSEQKKIGDLGITWTGFIIQMQMGVDLDIH